MSNVQFQCTALMGTNKVGKLKKDENGYYEVVLGGFNAYNSVNAYYPLDPVKAMFEESHRFMRRIKKGVLRGEYGHPNRAHGESSDSFLARVSRIDERSVSHHIRDVRLDFDRVKDDQGRPIVAVIGWVKPCGPHGEALRQQFENPDENVCFSIRSFTNDSVNAMGILNKAIVEIITWDYVNEGGISSANKYSCPSLESMDSLAINANQIERVINDAKHDQLGFESSDQCAVLQHLLETVKPQLRTQALPASMRW